MLTVENIKNKPINYKENMPECTFFNSGLLAPCFSW